MSESETPIPSNPLKGTPSSPPKEEHEFSSRNVRSNIAPIFHILQSEQLILQRTDQKAFTLMSILGVFMVFFLVHFPKIQINWFNFIMLILYLVAALVALIQLIMVINPRIKKREHQDDLPEINPTYFKGIVSFDNASKYGKYLRKIMDDENRSYTMFANQVYSVASINEYKHGHMQKAIRFFAVAIISELLIVMSVAYTRSLPFLFGG